MTYIVLIGLSCCRMLLVVLVLMLWLMLVRLLVVLVREC